MSDLALLKPFGIDLFCVGKKFLVFNMVSRNIKIKYRRSVLGILWTLVSPMAQAAILYFVFKVVLKIQIPHYLAFILSGVLPWAFFSQTLSEGADSLVGSVSLITKVPVPVQIFPYVGAMTNLVTLIFALPILIASALLSDVALGPSVVLILPYFAALFLMVYGMSLILGILQVYFRDLRHLITIVIQIWFYGTPVIYDASMIPAKYKWVIYANPIGSAFMGLHTIFGQGKWPSLTGSCVFMGWTVATLTVAGIFYVQFGSDIAENL